MNIVELFKKAEIITKSAYETLKVASREVEEMNEKFLEIEKIKNIKTVESEEKKND